MSRNSRFGTGGIRLILIMLDCISDKFVKPEVKQQVLLLFVEMGEKMSSNLAFMVALNEKRQIVMSGYQVRSFFF